MSRRKNKHNKKTRTNILFVVVCFLVGLILLLCGWINYQKFILHNTYPTVFGIGASIVISGSMEPTLSVNNLVITCQSDSYEVDDIVVFYDECLGQNVIHRITSINSDNKITTKGDANNTADKPIDASLIKGKYLFKI